MLLRGQRVPGGGHEADGFRHIQRQHKVGLDQRLIQRIGQIDLIRAQPLQHLVRSGCAEHKLHLRAERMIALQQTGQECTAQRVRQCDPQGAADLLRRLERGSGLLRGGQQGAGVGQKGLTCIGQPDSLAHPVEQRGLQLRFQLRDLRRYCRLRIAQLPRRAGKTVQLGNV